MSSDSYAKHVTSSMLESLVYHLPTNKLMVKFKTSGTCYVYSDVRKHEAAALLGAASHGTYFNAHIKGQFDEKPMDAFGFDTAFDNVAALTEPRRFITIDWVKVAGDGSIPVFPR